MRSHTGRRRNEHARRAILDAAVDLLLRAELPDISIDRIATEAGVGRQTIYRWWPSKGAVLAEAMAERAEAAAPLPDTGALAEDLRLFLRATFRTVGAEPAAGLLRALLAEAQRDPHAAAALEAFTAGRREQLRTLLDRASAGGEVAAEADLAILVEQLYGVLWYRLSVTHEPLDDGLADRLAGAAVAQAAGSRSAG
jgi:AcrR family transcriptional regulator